MRCWSNGRVLIKADAPSPEVSPGALLLDTSLAQQQPESCFQEVVQLPGRLDTHSAQALFTTHGHLYVRVNLKHPQQLQPPPLQQQQQLGLQLQLQ